MINLACSLIAAISTDNPALANIGELLNSAQINIEEAKHELQHHLDSFEANPERLLNIEERLNAIYDIARKHRVRPSELSDTYNELCSELQNLDCSDERLEELRAELVQHLSLYQSNAEKLSKQRNSAAKKLTKEIEGQLKLLGMQHCQFTVALKPNSNDTPQATGNESIEFLIAPNPGQPAQSMIKIASGGELSRISLAIQVVTASTSTIPTLCFDEVDVGIGGGTAEVVGNLLRKLGSKAQVLCVTHQAQVASKGHQHLFVSKASKNNETFTQVTSLAGKHQIEEIARMLGGIEITERTREHAKEMLSTSV
jgi:DNA repair protein RecN (Recombination protein N)